MDSLTIQKASELWAYLSTRSIMKPADAIVICCSYDLRVCDHACNLIHAGFSDQLVISGKSGNWTKHLWQKPEAEVFLERALQNSVPRNQIILEIEATNFGENITFSRKLIPSAKRVIFVSKPNSLLRVKLTAEAQWPEVDAIVSSPDISFPTEVSNVIGILGVIDEMVGDVERIQKYPEQGFQAEHSLPESILTAWQDLIAQGFNGHRMA
ncbi:MAG: YdcF family protein [Chloroflexota bacterium]